MKEHAAGIRYALVAWLDALMHYTLQFRFSPVSDLLRRSPSSSGHRWNCISNLVLSGNVKRLSKSKPSVGIFMFCCLRGHTLPRLFLNLSGSASATCTVPVCKYKTTALTRVTKQRNFFSRIDNDGTVFQACGPWFSPIQSDLLYTHSSHSLPRLPPFSKHSGHISLRKLLHCGHLLIPHHPCHWSFTHKHPSTANSDKIHLYLHHFSERPSGSLSSLIKTFSYIISLLQLVRQWILLLSSTVHNTAAWHTRVFQTHTELGFLALPTNPIAMSISSRNKQ